jgi:hypothetical protein
VLEKKKISSLPKSNNVINNVSSLACINMIRAVEETVNFGGKIDSAIEHHMDQPFQPGKRSMALSARYRNCVQ